MITQWKDLCDAHPQMASYEVIGKSLQGRDIWLFKIGTPSGGRIMYDGQGHGGEDGGTETLYKFCKWLLESKEPLANHILRHTYHLIIPILNIDAFDRRQNMRSSYTLENGTTINVPYGVDLNRNGIYGWGQSGSSNPSDPYSYRGLYGGSEPETMAYHNAAEKYRPDIYVNTHIGGDIMYYYSSTQQEQNILALKTQYETQYNITNTYSTTRGLRGGFIAADVDGSFGASGWLWEMGTWENLEPTLEGWLNKYYPRAFPVFLAFAKSAEKPPNDYFEMTTLQPNEAWTVNIPQANLTRSIIGTNTISLFLTPVEEQLTSTTRDIVYLQISNSTPAQLPNPLGTQRTYKEIELKGTIDNNSYIEDLQFMVDGKACGLLSIDPNPTTKLRFTLDATNTTEPTPSLLIKAINDSGQPTQTVTIYLETPTTIPEFPNSIMIIIMLITILLFAILTKSKHEDKSTRKETEMLG